MVSSKKVQEYRAIKVTKFHFDIIDANIEKILVGEINNVEVMALINEEAIKSEQPQIADSKTIKRMVKHLLTDQSEKISQYEKILRHNIGKRTNPNKIPYQETELGKKVINNYLPKIIAGEVTFDTIEKELKTSRDTVNKIIEEYYLMSGDEEGLENYKKAKKRNRGTSVAKTKKAKEMRAEVEAYDIVPTSEFLTLSEEEQDKQIIMKIRQVQLQGEKNGEASRDILWTENATKTAIKKVKDYFRSKNDSENGIENFSEEDIRYIIFRYPTITSRDPETLEEKLKILTSYEEIDYQTAYEMIKVFPTIMGYAADRIKEQLDLLQKEKLIHYVINRPSALMSSVGLKYALIQFAKERYQTNDLSNIKLSKIFLKNNSLKRLAGMTYDELKQHFPYDEIRGNDELYTINGQDIGKVTFDVDVSKSDKANNIVQQIVDQKNKGEER